MSDTTLETHDPERYHGTAILLLQHFKDNPNKPPPEGLRQGIKRFLDRAKEGIALERKARRRPDIPILTATSCLGILDETFRKLSRPPKDLDELEQRLLVIYQILEDTASQTDTEGVPVELLEEFLDALTKTRKPV